MAGEEAAVQRTKYEVSRLAQHTEASLKLNTNSHVTTASRTVPSPHYHRPEDRDRGLLPSPPPRVSGHSGLPSHPLTVALGHNIKAEHHTASNEPGAPMRAGR